MPFFNSLKYNDYIKKSIYKDIGLHGSSLKNSGEKVIWKPLNYKLVAIKILSYRD